MNNFPLKQILSPDTIDNSPPDLFGGEYAKAR